MVEDQSQVSFVPEGTSSHDPNRGGPALRVYSPPPMIDDDRNAHDTDSSLKNPQTRMEVAVPHVQYRIPLPQPRTNFLTLQAWEGVVTDVNDTSFAVKLVDLTSDAPDEEADIDFEDVSKDERSLVRVGAVFLLHVGYETSEGGQRRRTSILRFRRLPVWTDSELSSAKSVAQDQLDTIRWQ